MSRGRKRYRCPQHIPEALPRASVAVSCLAPSQLTVRIYYDVPLGDSVKAPGILSRKARHPMLQLS